MDVIHRVVAELVDAVDSLLKDELERAAGRIQRCAALIHGSAFGNVTKQARPVARGGLAPYHARILKAHIETHLEDTLSTRDLAQLVQLSPYHFCRVFRTSFGHSAHGYVMLRRLERARKLMMTTDRALGRIALDCGFSDQAHFNNIFRRHCGETPGRWRRTRTGVAEEGILTEAPA